MVCPEGTLVQHFVAGRLDDGLVALFEAHIEQCEECFLRLAAAAGEASQQARVTMQGTTRGGSRLDRCLASVLADDLVNRAAPLAGVERKSIGAYVVSGVLGVGGMGIVYRAQHRETGREVALKTVKVPWLASSLAMLRQEIDFLREAQHPRIVAIVDFDLVADEPWYAMELFEGHTLRELNQRLWASAGGLAIAASPAPSVAAGGRLADTLRLFERLCEPIDFIHRGGMVHGDLKPSNVFLRSETDPVLMDFGLASRARGAVGREALVVTGRLRGSLPYIAPEIIRGRIPDTRADLYALGCMLYESVVGSPPFDSVSGVEIIDMHLRRPPVPASRLAVGVPPELDALLLRLLAKNPYERFGHASALGAALAGVADTLSPPHEPRRGARASAQPTTLFRPPLVGRDDELAVVVQGLHRARHGASGSLFLISGQSGIGKTFFTAEAGQRAALAGMQVITGECLPLVLTADAPADAGSWPLQGFRRFFEGLRERCHEHGQTEIDQLFGERLPVLASSLPVLRHLLADAGSLEAPPPLPAAAARERIVTAVVDTLVSYASRGPTLVAIDDLHWADDLTLAVLERLDETILSTVPLVIVANYRSEEAGDAVRRLASRPGNGTLELGRLAAPEIRALVGGMLSMSTPPEPLVDYIGAHSEGIPFFAAEYLRSLVAAGALVYEVGTWSTHAQKLDEFSASRRSELPRTLQDLIRGRLERLAREAVSLLEAGAVIGRRFSVSLLGRMLGEQLERWTPLLEAAVAMQVTLSEDSETYTFLHDKIRETLYSGLSERRRMELHLAAARALEQSGSAPDEYGPIAHHFRQAGDVPSALDYLEKAGAHALAVAANADADRFFGEALELEASLPERLPSLRRARWLRQRGDALGGLGRMTESAEALEASAALLGQPFPRSKPRFAARLAREIATQVWHRVRRRPMPPLEGEEAETNLEVMRVFERMHEVSYYLGRDADLVLSTTVSLNSSERVGATPSRAIAYSNAAMLAGVLPVPALADHYFRLAAAAVRAAPDVSAESWMLEMEGSYRVWQGKRAEALEAMERAIELARRGGHTRRCDEAECVLIGLDVLSGFHARALARADVVLQSACKRNDLQVQSWLLLDKAEARVVRGELDAALAELGSVQSLLPHLGRPEQIWAAGLEAYVRHRRGEERAARAGLERGLTLLLSGQPVHGSCLGAYDRLAEMAVELCRRERASFGVRVSLPQAEKLCSILERVAAVFPISRPAAVLHRGELDLFLGRRPTLKVIEAWRRAVELSQTLGLPYQELRLRSAILAHSPLGPRFQRDRERVAELTATLELGVGAPSPEPVTVAQSAA
jgi:serine/threonine protein kinase/tetratricopeptide (TPR) repeat protein